MHSAEIYDVTIIGGGPTGMFAAFYAGIRELKVKIIETLPVLGGQVEIMYPEKNIYDVGAFPYIKGADLIAQQKKQMEPFDPRVCLDENVLTIEKKEEVFHIDTDKGTHLSRTILIATGQGSFEPRKLTFDYPEQYEETNLHYYVNPLETYRDKTVAITGGGDSAVDWALTLESIAKKVYIVHRRDKFRAHEAAVTRLKQSSVEMITAYVPNQLIGNEERLYEVEFKERRGDKIVTLPVDYFIVNYGFKSLNKQLNDWGLETEHNSVVVSQRMETNVPGIYAAGDVTTFDGKVKLIVTGYGEAPTAINSIIQYLNPDQVIEAPTTGDDYGAETFKIYKEHKKTNNSLDN